MQLSYPILCLVTDRLRCNGRPLEDVVDAAVEGGVGMVQLREKDLPASGLYSLSCKKRFARYRRSGLRSFAKLIGRLRFARVR